MRKTTLTILGIIGLLVLLLGLGVACEQVANFFTPNPPRPEITYGEFPFRIEYEVYGERIVVEDTIICEFNGFTSISCDNQTKYRRWKTSFASGRAMPLGGGTVAYLEVDSANKIYLYLGGPRYYMGDDFGGLPDCSADKYIKNSGGYSLKGVSQNELLNTYGIKVISYEFSEPIVNSFK